MSNDAKFVDGMFSKLPHQNAPDFVKLEISFKVEEFIEWAKANANDKGYVNVTVKQSKSGNVYGQLNDWQPKEQAEPQGQSLEAEGKEQSDDLPF